MAANLAGMFSQLNNAIQGNPTADAFGGLLGDVSQGAGNMLGSAIGLPERSMDFMNQRGQEQQAQEMAAQAMKSNDPKVMKQAAAALMQAGKMQEAQMLSQKADALGAKQSAILEAGQAEIQAESARIKKKQATAQAAAYATSQGDKDKAQAIRDGLLSPEAYMAYKMKEKELYELSKGEMLTDKDGNVIRVNPDLTVTGGSKRLATDVKLWSEGMQKAEQARAQATQMQDLSNRMANAGLEAGRGEQMTNFIKKTFGERGEDQYMRTEAAKIINTQAIQNLPPGPASDRDVTIVREGYPDPDTAGPEEMMRFFEAASRLLQKQADYDEMLAQYTIDGRHDEFAADWRQKQERVAYQEAINEVPDEQVELLLQHKDNPAALAAFRKNWGFDPKVLIDGATKY